jgi:hypothetical protein
MDGHADWSSAPLNPSVKAAIILAALDMLPNMREVAAAIADDARENLAGIDVVSIGPLLAEGGAPNLSISRRGIVDFGNCGVARYRMVGRLPLALRNLGSIAINLRPKETAALERLAASPVRVFVAPVG